MIISVTERGTFKRCKLKWDYSSFGRQSIEPIVKSRALNLGTLIHKACEDWLLNPDANLRELFMQRAVEAVDKARNLYKKNVGADMSQIELDPLYSAVQMGAFMAENYQKRWKKPLPDKYTLYSPEQTCIVPIPGAYYCPNCRDIYGNNVRGVGDYPYCPECGCDWVYHQLEGQLDALVTDQHGQFFVLERKTYSSRPNEHALRTSDQFLGYMWILTQLNIGPVGGVLYDGLWSRPKIPQGKTFEDLFLRTTIYRSETEIENWGKELVLEVFEMANNPAITRNRRWEGCYDCGFDPLCIAEFRGEDVDRLRKERYGKRERSSEMELVSEQNSNA